MNLEKFTDRAKGFLQSAQTVAIRMSHQRISPEHILKALLEDEQGMAAGLIAAAGGDAKRAVAETDAALAKIPAVSGGGAQQTPGLDNDAVRVLDQAEQVATKAGDSFVTVERLLLALVLFDDHRCRQGARCRRRESRRPQRSDQQGCGLAAPPTAPAPRTASTRSTNSRAT